MRKDADDMACKFPEHHGSDGGPGLLLPLGVTVAAVALCAGIITTIIHILAMIITFVGIAALGCGGAWLWWRLSHRPQLRQLPSSRPQITSPRHPAAHQLPHQQQPGIDQGGGMHLHLHGTEVTEFLRGWTDGRQ